MWLTIKKRVVAFWLRFEHYFNFCAAAAGFTFDLWLAKRPDSIADNILLLTYLCIAATIIILLNHKTRQQMDAENPTEPLALLFLLQFCFGGLANNLLILYGKSGTLAGSALFVVLLLGIVLGNEFFRNRYVRLNFNVGVYYLLLLTYVIIAAPTFIFHSIGTAVFIYSGLISLAIIAVFLIVIRTTVLRGVRERKHFIEVGGIVAGIFLVFNALYFLDIIPPVPLSLKGIGVYHSIMREPSGNYAATYEAPAWFVFWRDTAATFTIKPGQSAYCFSAVFAPGKLTAPISHKWQWYDTRTKEWITKETVSFGILGGRDGGYRGYSIKANLPAGQWRCDVETQNGALIGRMSFTVIESALPANLSTTTL
ncbi:MAG: hypothetical protein JWO43_321 [Candidatus Adlerbacteria bacterium]|nr:hypothetical protein [Candidatus Adlerbacteria bacterium]